MPTLVAPNTIPVDLTTPVVFLAGSIEMGKAEPWQNKISDLIGQLAPQVLVANPRRESWDASLSQELANPTFNQQVRWEQDYITRADLVIFYFQGGTFSPITLLELGGHLARLDAPRSTIVCCPKDFWRRGNIEVMLDRRGLDQPLKSFDELMEYLRQYDWKSLVNRAGCRQNGTKVLAHPINRELLANLIGPAPSSEQLCEKTYPWVENIPLSLRQIWDVLPNVARNALIVQAKDQGDRG